MVIFADLIPDAKQGCRNIPIINKSNKKIFFTKFKLSVSFLLISTNQDDTLHSNNQNNEIQNETLI